MSKNRAEQPLQKIRKEHLFAYAKCAILKIMLLFLKKDSDLGLIKNEFAFEREENACDIKKGKSNSHGKERHI